MFAKQKNTLALITGWIGGIGFLITAALGIFWIVFVFQTTDPHPDTLKKISIMLMVGLCSAPIIISGPLLISLFFLRMYPSILLSRNGVEYQDRFGISKEKLSWKEIKKIIRYSDKLILLVVEKEERFLFFDGLYFNKLYGQIVGRKDAVIFMSSGLEQFSQILEVIIKNSESNTLSVNKAGW